MTHTSTEQERAEFEKYMLLENYFSERDLVWDGVDGYDCTDADDAFGIWLIARRAQVVKGNHVTFQAQDGEAAPVQMPEAVVPFAVFDCHGFYTEKPSAKQAQAFCDHYNKRDADGGGSAPYTVQALYTEHQVRQLLAAHGIQEQST